MSETLKELFSELFSGKTNEYILNRLLEFCTSERVITFFDGGNPNCDNVKKLKKKVKETTSDEDNFNDFYTELLYICLLLKNTDLTIAWERAIESGAKPDLTAWKDRDIAFVGEVKHKRKSEEEKLLECIKRDLKSSISSFESNLWVSLFISEYYRQVHRIRENLDAIVAEIFEAIQGAKSASSTPSNGAIDEFEVGDFGIGVTIRKKTEDDASSIKTSCSVDYDACLDNHGRWGFFDTVLEALPQCSELYTNVIFIGSERSNCDSFEFDSLTDDLFVNPNDKDLKEVEKRLSSSELDCKTFEQFLITLNRVSCIVFRGWKYANQEKNIVWINPDPDTLHPIDPEYISLLQQMN